MGHGLLTPFSKSGAWHMRKMGGPLIGAGGYRLRVEAQVGIQLMCLYFLSGLPLAPWLLPGPSGLSFLFSKVRPRTAGYRGHLPGQVTHSPNAIAAISLTDLCPSRHLGSSML